MSCYTYFVATDENAPVPVAILEPVAAQRGNVVIFVYTDAKAARRAVGASSRGVDTSTGIRFRRVRRRNVVVYEVAGEPRRRQVVDALARLP